MTYNAAAERASVTGMRNDDLPFDGLLSRTVKTPKRGGPAEKGGAKRQQVDVDSLGPPIRCAKPAAV